MWAVGAVRAVWAVWAVRAARAVRAAGVGHGLEPVNYCFSWQARCGGGGEGGVGGESGESGEGGGDWAWIGVRKILLFMAGALEGGEVRAVGAVRAVWAVWAVRAGKAAGIGHGLEPVKYCFSWQGRWRGGGKCERWGRWGGVGGVGDGGGVGGVGGQVRAIGGGGGAWTGSPYWSP